MPRSRGHSRTRSRSHSNDRDREVKRRRFESPDSSHHRRSVSVDSDVTPQKTMSPKQVQKKLDSAKKRDERQKEREEREKKRQEEKQKREEEKIKERKEREEQKRKEREEKEEQKCKEREEKEQKRKEHEQKEVKRQQELKEKQRLQRKKEEQMKKEQALFANFFVQRKPLTTSDTKNADGEKKSYAFMPFQVKSDMRLAPSSRRTLTKDENEHLISQLEKQIATNLYLDDFKKGIEPRKSDCTWPDDDDVGIVEEFDLGEHVQGQSEVAKMRAKFLKFHDNQRPAYFGTWRKKSKSIMPRKPYALDKENFDYDVDSDADWEEEEPGESLRDSDDEEKDNESDDYEVDNDLFVPHGYLSDEEGIADENAVMSPEMQKAKLKLLQIEFDEDMKSKTNKTMSRMIGPVWERKHVPKIPGPLEMFLADRRMIANGPVVILKRYAPNSDLKLSAWKQGTPVRKQLSNELIPEFLQLVHGNINNQGLLVNEFLSYLSMKNIDVSISKASLSSQLKQLAKWQKCPDEGAMFNKFCWYVNNDVRNQFNLNLSLPNKWTYTLTDENNGPKKKLII